MLITLDSCVGQGLTGKVIVLEFEIVMAKPPVLGGSLLQSLGITKRETVALCGSNCLCKH